MIQLIPVYPEDTPQLQFIGTIYIQSFPADERREFTQVVRLLRENRAFHLTLLALDSQPVGFISHWQWSHFAYIEHFAVDPTLRGSGYGAKGLQLLLQQLGSPVVLEVEPPTDEWSCRRVNFYRRLGFELCSRPYIQPPYSPDKQSVALLLMSYGAMNLDSNFDTVVAQLHGKVYGVSCQ